MNVLLIGPPGSGKGTQGERLAHQLGLTHIAAGDLLRAEVAEQTDIGRSVAGYLERGELVPDDVILDLIVPRLLRANAEHGFLLDGFPRSVDQLHEVLRRIPDPRVRVGCAVYLDVGSDVLIKRILDRAEIEGRSDDTADVITRRLEIFEEETRPLVEYYRERGVLYTVDAAQDADDVTTQILAALGNAS
jgi:adenylate kinase